MGRRRRNSRRRAAWAGVLLLAGGAFALWRVEQTADSQELNASAPALLLSPIPPASRSKKEAQPPRDAAPPPANESASSPAANEPEKPSLRSDAVPANRDAVAESAAVVDFAPKELPKPVPPRFTELLAAGEEALARKDSLTARAKLHEALRAGVDSAQAASIIERLGTIADETILSPRILDGDRLVERYVIRTGDSLARIAAKYQVSADLLASINAIPDKNRIREGQTIKTVHGPFRAEVTKSCYVLDVYLGDTFVRRFPVGLGADDSTPTGEWRVGTKLVNPTYYPPRGGAIIAAEDPANPLGERWIGLVGVSGSAVAQERYGIHGTNEPDSIGKSLSMGCIRMKNDDVEWVYQFLLENVSTVLVRE